MERTIALLRQKALWLLTSIALATEVATGMILRRSRAMAGHDGVLGFAGFRKDSTCVANATLAEQVAPRLPPSPKGLWRTGAAGCFTTSAMLIAVAGIFCGCASLYNGKISLTEKSVPRSVIIVADNADPIEKHAAVELAMFIKKTSGAEVRIENKEIPGLYPIYLKTDDKLDVASDEGFAVTSDTSALRIIGKQPIGVLYGVYDFLEKYVGYRWFAPYDDCEFTPKAVTIKIAANIADRQSPSFEFRDPHTTGGGNVAFGKGARKTWDWMARNKIQIWMHPGDYALHRDFLRERGAIVRFGGHETLTMGIPDSKYFATHPEYFCLVDGKRVPQGAYGPGAVLAHACLSHPDVARLCAENILNFFEKYPDGSYLIGLGDADTKGAVKWCQCENCLKVGSKTTRFISFANAVTKAVHEKNPKADMWVWGYSDFRNPPVGVTLDPSLTFELCIHGRSYKDPLFDPNCAFNEKYLKWLDDWQKLAKRVTIYEYAGLLGDAGFPGWKTLADDLRFYHKRGIIGWENETTAPDAGYPKKYDTPLHRAIWRSNWQYLYLAAKMLWNVKEDDQKLLYEARTLYYGKAAPAMEKYYAKLVDIWNKTPGGIGYGCPNSTMARCLTMPGAQAELEKYLAEAKGLAGDDQVILEKVKQDEISFEYYWVKPYEKYRASPQKSPLSAAKASSPPIIDGNAADKQWNLAETLSDFVLPGSDKKPENATIAKILFDDKNVYFLIEAMEKNAGGLKMNSEKRDDNGIFRDDCVEIFILNPKGKEEYYQFAVNPKGCVFDAKWKPGLNGDYDYNAEVEVKTAVLSDRWIAEIRIPSASLAVSGFTEGSQWKINVARTRQAKSDSDPSELSSLSGYGNHDYERFRAVNFGAP